MHAYPFTASRYRPIDQLTGWVAVDWRSLSQLVTQPASR